MTTGKKVFTFLFLVVTLITALSPVTATNPELTNEAIDQFLNTFVPYAMQRHHVPGVFFAAVKDGEILAMRGFGYSDIEAKLCVDPMTTALRAGSVAKLFTGMAVMQLVEQGRLNLNEDVNKYIKGFRIPDTYPEHITLRHLLTHTAGFDERNLRAAEFGKTVYPQLSAYLAAEQPPRIRPPGQLIQYSNYGVALAGYIVECVSGMPFAQYVQKKILIPLGMEHSSFELTANIKNLLAASYTWQKGQYVEVPYVHISATPAGGLITTAADMAIFMIANLNKGKFNQTRVLGAQYLNSMQAQQFIHHPELTGVGYTWWIGRRNGYRVLYHGGDIWQFSTQLLLVPEENFGLFICGNSPGAAVLNNEFISEFFATFFPESELQGTSAPTAGKRWPAAPAAVSGMYRTTRYSLSTAEKVMSLLTQFRLAANRDGTLTLTPPAVYGQPPTTWVPITTNSQLYRDTASDDTMTFAEKGGMYIGAFAFAKVPFYETPTFTIILLTLVTLVFLWVMLAWLFRRRVSGLAAAVGLVNIVAIVVIFAMMLLTPPWILATAVPPILFIALALPLVGIAMTLTLIWQIIKRMVRANKWENWSFSRRITPRGFTTNVLPWLCVAADVAFVWFLYTWNLLGWKF